MSTYDAKADADEFERTAFMGNAAEWRANLAVKFAAIYNAGREAGLSRAEAVAAEVGGPTGIGVRIKLAIASERTPALCTAPVTSPDNNQNKETE